MARIRLLVLGLMLCSPLLVQAESLFSTDSYRPIVADHRALKKGDVLTVLITESTIVKTTANTTQPESNP